MSLPLFDLVPAELRRAWAADGICPDLDLYALFRAHRLMAPAQVAVIDDAGSLAYAELDGLARAAAAGLRDLGVCVGDVVGVQLPNGRDAVIADLALAALGAVALPFPLGRGVAEAVSFSIVPVLAPSSPLPSTRALRPPESWWPPPIGYPACGS